MKLYPVSKPRCDCDADTTAETTVQRSFRNKEIKRAKQVFHYRERDQAHFWHWSDQEVVKI